MNLHGDPHVCAGLCHTILFHRALGNVTPKDIDSELFDITYVRSFRYHSQYSDNILPIVIGSSGSSLSPTHCLLDICMPGRNQASCGDPDIESRLEAGINDFCTTMEKRPHADTAQVEVVRNITHLPFGEPTLTGLHEVINLVTSRA